MPGSYTHLAVPTKRVVERLVVAACFDKNNMRYECVVVMDVVCVSLRDAVLVG